MLSRQFSLLAEPGFSFRAFSRCVKVSLIALLSSITAVSQSLALGLVSPHPMSVSGARFRAPHRTHSQATRHVDRHGVTPWSHVKQVRSAKPQIAAGRRQLKKSAARTISSHPLQPQDYLDKLTSESVAPGVVHRSYRGALNINVIDVDMVNAPVKVRPYLAGESFDRLKDVAAHAREAHALAAINANYFKRDGTPLGTLIVDNEWVAGPIYDRVSLGITKAGYVRIEPVRLGGLLTASNPQVSTIWVNNVNQPRRTGARLVAYTRRWGAFVKLPYAGCLVAVDAQGRVVDKGSKTMGIPWGGYVLTDSKDSAISQLQRGDDVQIQWKTAPSDWQDVVEAVSGGPMLIKDGRLYVDLKAEKFRRSWTGSQIHARTAAGVTSDNHLLLVTIEGSHTLWDLAKFLHRLGAVEALNLDGGGSTTMVVNGTTVTRNQSASQRRVASSLVVLDMRNAELVEHNANSAFCNSTTVEKQGQAARVKPAQPESVEAESVPTGQPSAAVTEPKELSVSGELQSPGSVEAILASPVSVPTDVEKPLEKPLRTLDR